jgi:hypothetical protein
MFKQLDIKSTLTAGIIAAMLFCIPVYLYIMYANYEESWLLYLGSFLFMVVMWIHTIRESKKRNDNESTVALAFSAHAAAVAGILFSCILSFLLLAIFVHGYLHSGNTAKVLAESPVNTIHDKTGGLSFNIFMTATIVNFSVGSFTGIVLPFYLKKNQTKDPKKPTPLHQHGVE